MLTNNALLLLLGLGATLAAAAPARQQQPQRRQTPHYPPTSLSNGFVLVANVTAPEHDLTPSINHWLFQGYHTGAGLDAAVLHAADAENPGRIFYLNGTAEQVRYGDGASVLSDAGTPPFPQGIDVQSPAQFDTPLYPAEHAVGLDVGSGTPANIAAFPEPYPYLTNGEGAGTFVACNRTLAYYDEAFVLVRYVYGVPDPVTGLEVATIPADCAPITLIPQCAALEDLPAGSLASHEYANTINCYDDVASIDWSQYGP